MSTDIALRILQSVKTANNRPHAGSVAPLNYAILVNDTRMGDIVFGGIIDSSYYQADRLPAYAIAIFEAAVRIMGVGDYVAFAGKLTPSGVEWRNWADLSANEDYDYHLTIKALAEDRSDRIKKYAPKVYRRNRRNA